MITPYILSESYAPSTLAMYNGISPCNLAYTWNFALSPEHVMIISNGYITTVSEMKSHHHFKWHSIQIL